MTHTIRYGGYVTAVSSVIAYSKCYDMSHHRLTYHPMIGLLYVVASMRASGDHKVYNKVLNKKYGGIVDACRHFAAGKLMNVAHCAIVMRVSMSWIFMQFPFRSISCFFLQICQWHWCLSRWDNRYCMDWWVYGSVMWSGLQQWSAHHTSFQGHARSSRCVKPCVNIEISFLLYPPYSVIFTWVMTWIIC